MIYSQSIDRQSVTDACWVEHKILEHVKAALRLTLDWKVPAVGLPRKLSSVRFTLRSFERHLRRLMKLEENGGYMASVGEFKPNLQQQTELLLAEHQDFRAALDSIVPAMDALSKDEQQQFEQLCQEIRALLQRIDEHDRKEVEILQEALLSDEGGEGG
jgi:hypothetical protein